MPDSAYAWKFQAEGGQQAGALFQIIQRLDQIVHRLTQRKSDIRGTFQGMGAAASKATRSTRGLSSAVAEITKETIKTANGVVTIVNEYDRYGKVVRRTVDDVNTLGTTTTKTRRVFDAQGNTVKKTSSTFSDYTEKVKKSEKTTRTQTRATSDATKKKQALFQILTKGAGIWNTWNKAVDFAAKRIRQLYTGFTALFSKVQEVGGAFERSRATMEVLAKSAGANDKEVQKLTETTKHLGRTTEFTAQQAADGAITLLKSGETASGAWTKLDVALSAALATGLKIDKVAAIGNHAFKIFGDNLGKVGDRAMDYETAMKVMIASANSADVTVSQLDASLVKGGDILARLGVPLTRVNAALGLLANKGHVGSRAMRMLSIGTKRLVDGTGAAQNALRELGVSVLDDAGNFRDLGAVMQDIGDALDLRAPNEQVKLMKGLFGAADKAMGTLLDAGVEGFDKLEGSILKNIDVMDELEKARGKGMVGSYKQFRSALEGVYIELTEILSVPISKFWQTLADILNVVSDRIKSVAQGFKGGKGSLEDWLNALKSGSFEGIFDDLPAELAPHIETLKTLFKGLVDTVINLFKAGLADAAIEIWDAIFTEDVQAKAIQFGITVGEAVIKGILSTGIGKVIAGSMALNALGGVAGTVQTGMGVASMLGVGGGAAAGGTAAAGGAAAGGTALGAAATVGAVGVGLGLAANYGVTQVANMYDRKAAAEDQRGVQVLTEHLGKMIDKKRELAEIPLMERTEADEAKIQRVQQEIVTAGEELEKMGAMGPKGDALAQYYADQVGRAKTELEDLEKKQKETAESVSGATTEASTTNPPPQTGEFKPEDYRTPKDRKLQEETDRKRQAMDEYRNRQAATEASRRDRTIELMQTGEYSKTEAERIIATEDAIKRAKAGEGRKSPEGELSGVSEAQLESKQSILSKQEELISAEKRQKEAIEKSNEVLHETQIEINNAGAAFDKWLLNPVNVFQQKLLGIKEKFSGITDSLQGKKVDIEEKFGLKTSEEADKKRAQNLQKSLDRDKRMLELAQEPEEQMKIRERMAGKAEQLADLSEGPQQERFAEQAVKHLEQAEQSAVKAQELRAKEVEIEQAAARENVSEYEALVAGAQTEGSRAGYLEQLKEAYMSLGPEYREKAVQTQEEWKRSKAEAAAEESEYFKRMAEAGEIQVELLQRAVDALEQTSQATKEQMHIPPDAEYADAA